MLILEAVLIVGYFFAQILSVAVEVFPALERFSTPLFTAGLTVLAAAGIFAGIKWPRLKGYNKTTLVIGHLLLYGAIFVSYNKFETHYASMGESVYDATFSMSFFNTAAVFAVALVTAFLIPVILEASFIRKYFRKGYLIALGCISFYAAFAMLGDSLFFQYDFSPVTLMVYLLGVLWVFPVLLEILALYELLRVRMGKTGKGKQHSHYVVWLTCFGIFMAIWLVYLAAFNPAQMSGDSMGMWREATSGGPIAYLGFPTLDILFVRLLSYIIPHPMFVVVVQMILFAALCAFFMLELYKRRIRFPVLCIFAVIFAALPPNGLMITTLWSNIPYTISLLYLTYSIWRLCSPDRGKIVPYINISLALVLTWSTRLTGFMPAIFCIALLVFLSFKNGLNMRILASTIAGCILVFLVQVPLYDAIRSDDVSEQTQWRTLFDGIHGVVYYEGDLPEDTQAFLESMMPLEKWREAYSIYDLNTDYYPEELNILSEQDGFFDEIFSHYVSTLKHEPLLLIKSRLANSNLVWGIAQPKGSYNERCMTWTASADIGFPHSDNILTTVLKKVVYPVSIAFAPLDIVLYRSGIYIVLSMVLCVFLTAYKKFKSSMLFLPMLGDIVALIIAMNWPVFRNIWFIPAIFVFIAPLLLSEASIEESREK